MCPRERRGLDLAARAASSRIDDVDQLTKGGMSSVVDHSHPAGDPGRRRVADVAVQLGVGLLPERRSRTRAADPDHPAPDRPYMIQILATPGSGDGRARATAEALAEAIRARGHPVAIEVFHDLHRLTRWSRSCPRSFSRLVCVGGDATMSAAAAAAIRHRAPFLPVPSGFGNLFAHAFGHTDDIPAAIDCLEAGDVAWVDAGMSHGEIFLSHESFGVLDEIQNAVEARPDQPRARWLRLLAYWRAGLRRLAGGAASSFQVEVDGTLV